MSKSFLESTTIWGALMILIQLGAQALGLDLAPEQVAGGLEAVWDLVAVALVVKGRKDANQPIHFLPGGSR